MRGKEKWLIFVLVALAFTWTGCAPTQTLLQDDNASYQRHEQMEMVPEPSGRGTNQELWMDMEGGG